MKRQILIAATLLGVLGFAGISQAEQSPETVKCGSAIEKGSAKFYKAVYSGIRSCLLGIQKCDLIVDAQDKQDCLAKLLLITPELQAKGKCAIGKLDEGVEYFGNNASTVHDDEVVTSKIGKAFQKFILKTDDKCLQVAADLSTGPDGLGYDFGGSPPVNVNELMNLINKKNLTGIACSAHHDLLVEFPDRDALVNELYLHADSANMARGLLYFTIVTTCQ